MSTVFQARFHGRGGQGVVTAAEILSVAAFLEKKHAQAFPSFGSERMGAPVMSFCRISGQEIRSREPILEPDALIIQDPTLLNTPDTFKGLSPEGMVLINTGRKLSELGIDKVLDLLPPGHIFTVPASEIALHHIKRPLPNAAMLGGLAAMSGIVTMESLGSAIKDRLPAPVADANIAAAKAAYESVMADKQAIQKTGKRAC